MQQTTVISRSQLNLFSKREISILNIAQAVKDHNSALLIRKQSYWQIDYWQYKGQYIRVFLHFEGTSVKTVLESNTGID